MSARCVFCGADPYHYVDNGVGMEAVAVTCCALGVATYDHRNEPDADVSMTVGELREVGSRLSAASEAVEVLDDILNYDGSAANALEDPYVTNRARAALSRAGGQNAE